MLQVLQTKGHQYVFEININIIFLPFFALVHQRDSLSCQLTHMTCENFIYKIEFIKINLNVQGVY